MQEKRTSQKHFSLLTRFAAVCGVLLGLACASLAGVAQENYEHHHSNKIYAIDADQFASSPLIDLLSRDYSIVAMDTVTPPFKPYPVLAGPAALANQDATALLVRAYRAGLTVAIVYATRQEANRFDALVEGEPAASCLPASGAATIPLYALQRTTREEPEEVSRYCLPTVVQADPQTDASDEASMEGQNRDRSGETEEQWLNAVFAPQAPPPPLQSSDVDANSINLDSLSQKTHCSEFFTNASGQVQDDFFVTSLRSFDSQRDYYYVQNFPQVKSFIASSYFEAAGFQPLLSRPGFRDKPLTGTRLLFTQPATATAYVSEYTNSRSTTVSGSVGFQGLSLNVSVGVSVTVGNSTTVTVPPVTIENVSNLESGSAGWRFRPANPRPNLLYDTAVSWVWFIDKAVYGDTPNNVPEVSSYFKAGTAATPLSGVCGFPPPFPTFDVSAPQILSVDPAEVQRGGGTFLIHGARMYPGILRNVLLGGDALPTANFVPISDTEIRVVVPSSQMTGPNPIQVNTSFDGSVLPSNTDVKVDVR